MAQAQIAEDFQNSVPGYKLISKDGQEITNYSK